MIHIGTVTKAHGVKGEMKVILHLFSPDSFVKQKALYIDGAEYAVISARIALNEIILQLEGVNDRNAADAMRGKRVFIDKPKDKDLAEGEYLIADILGSRVICNGVLEGFVDGYIGTLTKVLQYGAADIYVVENGDKEIMFPALNKNIIDIDIDNKIIITDCKGLSETIVINQKL